MLENIKEIMSISFKSKQQLDEERPKFPLLPTDDYQLQIVDIKRNTRPKYMKPDQIEDIIDFTFEVQGLRDGGIANDVDGEDATGRKVFFTARPQSIGFQRDGTPAKTRCLVAYAMGKAVEDSFDIEEWEQLLGAMVFAEIVQYTTQKGEKRNKISRFLLPPRQRKPINVKDEDIPVVEE